MEEKLNEALNNAGITEEELTANGEAARKAMEAKADAAAASEAKVEENKETIIEEDKNMERKDIKSKVITVLKWTGYCVACAAIGFAIGTLIKSGAAAEAAETAAESAE
jgi:hypothetical protein